MPKARIGMIELKQFEKKAAAAVQAVTASALPALLKVNAILRLRLPSYSSIALLCCHASKSTNTLSAEMPRTMKMTRAWRDAKYSI